MESEGYTPSHYASGEYPSGHINITATGLVAGRRFFYLDDDPVYASGTKIKRLDDLRPLTDRFAPTA